MIEYDVAAESPASGTLSGTNVHSIALSTATLQLTFLYPPTFRKLTFPSPDQTGVALTDEVFKTNEPEDGLDRAVGISRLR